MARLDIERQHRLEPERVAYAKKKLAALGFTVTEHNGNELRFQYKGHEVKFYPYSGWATGATIQDGRGLRHLLDQINSK